MVSVFLPCAPNPTTGFWFYIPVVEVVEVPLTVDDAIKLVMSAGVIQPKTQQKLAELAEATTRDKAPEGSGK